MNRRTFIESLGVGLASCFFIESKKKEKPKQKTIKTRNLPISMTAEVIGDDIVLTYKYI